MLTLAILCCLGADLVTPTIPGAFALRRPYFCVEGLVARDGNGTVRLDPGDVAHVQRRTEPRPLHAATAENAPADGLFPRPDLAILRLTPTARSLLADDS